MGEPNWANRSIFTGDNLDVMRGMNSVSVDLIYLDPPHPGRGYNVPIRDSNDNDAQLTTIEDKLAWGGGTEKLYAELLSGANRRLVRLLTALVGGSEEDSCDGAGTGLLGRTLISAHLVKMAARLVDSQRLLKSTGSLYLHCDPTTSHYQKIMLDSIFGERNFRSEIVWKRTRAFISRRRYGNISDTLLFYTRSNDHTWNSSYTRAKAPLQNVWDDINPLLPHSRERTGYPGQKPLALLERIIRVSSNAGDIVLDPFCGCATTFVAAENLKRQWVGIDCSPKTCELVVRRFSDAQPPLPANRIVQRCDIPRRTDLD